MVTTTQFCISIYLPENSQINPVFIKANSFILNKFKNQFEKIDTESKKIEKLKELWKTEFDAILEEDCDSYKNKFLSRIYFLNEEAMTLFLLRWI